MTIKPIPRVASNAQFQPYADAFLPINMLNKLTLSAVVGSVVIEFWRTRKNSNPANYVKICVRGSLLGFVCGGVLFAIVKNLETIKRPETRDHIRSDGSLSLAICAGAFQARIQLKAGKMGLLPFL